MKDDAAVTEAWKIGQLSWRLPPRPRLEYNKIRAARGKMPYVVLAHRNFAKTTIGLTIADENCRRQPKGRPNRSAIVFKTKDHASKVIKPIMEHYLRDCPVELRPRALKSDYVWRYPNGSTIDFFGGDHEHIETARGRGFDDVFFDEGGHQANLHDNVHSIMLPCLDKLRGEYLLVISTPSTEPAHYFELMCEQAEAAGRYSFIPASENEDVTDDWRAARAAECGGFDSLDYQREYECRFVLDPTTTVLPGINEARIRGLDGKPALVQRVPVRVDREWYCSMDIGGKHLTFLGWGYYETETDTVFIARELADRNADTPNLAGKIKLVESTLFGEQRPEYLHRWADNNNLFLLHDLSRQEKLSFKATRKDQKMAQIGSLRKLIAEGRFVIDESCTLLLSTLKRAQWKKAGKTDAGFAEDPEIGHADGLDMSLYLVRNVSRRPYPKPIPTWQQQQGLPEYNPQLATPGLRQLSQTLQTEPGWTE